MFTDLEIQNFRSIREIALTKLARLNVIAGVNGAGKSSILEAIFLLCGGAKAELVLSLGGLRTDQSTRPFNEYELTSIYSDLDVMRPVSIRGRRSSQKGTNTRLRRLEITPIENAQAIGSSSADLQIVTGLNAHLSEGKKQFNSHWKMKPPLNPVLQNPQFSAVARQFPQFRQDDFFDVFTPTNNPLIVAQYISPSSAIGQQGYDRLVSLVKTKRTHEITKIMSLLEPSIKNLLPINEKGQPRIFADMGRTNELLPLGVLGSGFEKLFDIAMAYEVVNNGVVLIDEIESGFHYSKYDDIIEFIYESAVLKNNQVFITTHSREILSHFATWIEKRSSKNSKTRKPSVSFSRIWRDRADRRGATYLDANEFMAAEHAGIELR